MPGQDFYAGLSLAEQVLKFSEHHHHPSTRHISAAESQMLQKAAAASKPTRSASGTHFVIAFAALGVSAFVIRQAGPSLRSFGRRLGKKRQQEMGIEDHPLTPASEHTDEPRQNEAGPEGTGSGL